VKFGTSFFSQWELVGVGTMNSLYSILNEMEIIAGAFGVNYPDGKTSKSRITRSGSKNR
jgi:hypothetical protein